MHRSEVKSSNPNPTPRIRVRLGKVGGHGWEWTSGEDLHVDKTAHFSSYIYSQISLSGYCLNR